MNYYSKETATKLMQKEIEIMKAALLHQESIEAAVKQFNGKVFNKRLNTAIEGIDKRLSVKVSDYFFYITYTAQEYKERSIESTSTSGYRSTLYVERNSTNLTNLSIYSEFGSYKDNPYALNADKRIRSDAIIDNIRLRCDRINKNVASLESEIKNIDAILTEFKRIKSEEKTFLDRISYVTRQYFDIEF